MSRKIELRNADVPELLLYDEIGPSWAGRVGAQTVIEALASVSGAPKLRVRINSPGGDVFEGFAIYNALTRFAGEIETHVDSLAASIASIIAMAGKTITMAENASMMIHNCWTMAMGDAAELRRVADVCQKQNEQIVRTYAARTGQPPEQLQQWMDAETWMTAEEAVDRKFADHIGQPLRVAAHLPGSIAARFRNTPEHLTAPTRRDAPLRLAAQKRLSAWRAVNRTWSPRE